MRELAEDIMAKAMKRPADTVNAVILPRQSIGKCTECTFPKAELVDLSHNILQSVSDIFDRFPAGWWFDLSFNALSGEIKPPCPSSLGLLDLTDNSLGLDALSAFSSSVIYRLKIDITNEVTRRSLFETMHVFWVLNDDFVKSEEISTAMNTGSGGGSGGRIDWFFGRQVNEREKDAMDILNNHLPCKHQFSNPFRLDLVLDDYLQQAYIYNSQDIVGVGSGLLSPMPVVRPENVLSLPHLPRLDLSVLLTASVLFKVPAELFADTLSMILLPLGASEKEIKDLIELPTFAKTALVCLIRRMCRREQAELKEYGEFLKTPFAEFGSRSGTKVKHLGEDRETGDGTAVTTFARDKYVIDVVNQSTLLAAVAPLIPSKDLQGFRFLKTVRSYLSSELPNRGSLSASDFSPTAPTPFSEMELDLLSHLPDIPTVATCPPPDSPAFRDWVALVARHTVVLMTRCPSCPPLTVSQRSKAHNDTHRQLRPLLVAAEMTYEDLEIVTTGPRIDGRVKAPHQVLSYGDGVPTGVPSHLSWNAGESRSRDYPKPWDPNNTRMSNVPTTAGTDDAYTDAADEEQEGLVPTIVSASRPVTQGVAPDMCDDESILDFTSTNPNGTADDAATANSQSAIKIEKVQRPKLPHAFSRGDSGISETTISHLLDVTYDENRGQAMLSPGAPTPQRWDQYADSLKKARHVSGFSSDSTLDASFMLAPEDEVEVTNRVSSHPANKWNDIGQPPAILHPHSQIPLKQPPRSPQDSTQALVQSMTAVNLSRLSRQPSQNTIQRKESGTSAISRQLSRQLSRSGSRPEFQFPEEGLKREKSPLERKLTRSDSRMREKQKNEAKQWLKKFDKELVGSILRRKDSSAGEGDMAELMMSMKNAEEKLLKASLDMTGHASYSPELVDFGDNLSESTGMKSEANSRTITDLREQLLKDMGTTRNVKKLSEINRKNAILLKNQEKRDQMLRDTTVRVGSRIFVIAQTPDKEKIKSSAKNALPSQVQWSSFAKKIPAPAENQPNEEFFLTGAGSECSFDLSSKISDDDSRGPGWEDGDEHGGRHEAADPPLRQLSAPASSDEKAYLATRGMTPAELQVQGVTESVGWDGSEPVTTHLQKTMKCPEIYTLSNDIEWGGMGPAGKINSSWYPCYRKKMMTLDPSAPVHAARREVMGLSLTKSASSFHLKSSEGAVAGSRSPLRPNSSNAKTLKPSEYTNAKLEKVEPIILAEADHSTKFYYHSRGKQVFRSSVAPPTEASAVMSDSGSNRSFVVTDLMSNSGLVPVSSAQRDVDLDSVDSYDESIPDHDSLQLSQEHINSMEITLAAEVAASPSTPPLRGGSPNTSKNTQTFSPTPRSLSSNRSSVAYASYDSALTAPNLAISAGQGLPPIFHNKKISKHAEPSIKRKLMVQMDPYAMRDGNARHASMKRKENISVIKPAKNCLQLNRSFRHTVPNRFVAK